jgi:hypothetical protein
VNIACCFLQEVVFSANGIAYNNRLFNNMICTKCSKTLTEATIKQAHLCVLLLIINSVKVNGVVGTHLFFT